MVNLKKAKVFSIFSSILLLVIVVTASFAYFGIFNVDLNNNIAVNINAVSPGYSTFTSNATQLNLVVSALNMIKTVASNENPAAENTATLTVNLMGPWYHTTTCTYDIVYEYDSSSYIYGGTGTKHVSKNSDKEITLQVANVNGTNNFASEKNFDYDSNWNGLKRTLVSGATISSDGSLTTQNISITGRFYNLNVSQSSIGEKAFTGKVYVTNNSCKISERYDGYEPTKKEVLATKGTITLDNGTVIDIFDSQTAIETMKSYLNVENFNPNYEKITGYTFTAGFIVSFKKNIKYVDATFYISTIKYGDEAIIRQYINGKWIDMEYEVVEDNFIKIKVEQEGAIEVLVAN